MEFNEIEQTIVSLIVKNKLKPDSREKLTQHLLWAKHFNRYPYKILGGKDQSSGDKTVLSHFEIYLSKMIGPMRTKAARQAGLPNALVADEKDENFMEYLGIAGEIAYGKHHNLYPYETFKIQPRTTKEDNGDYVHEFDSGSFCVDVKITPRDDGRLLLAPWKIGNPESYIRKVNCLALYTGNIDNNNALTFQGYMITREMLNHPQRPLRHGGPKLYWAKQEELTFNLEEAYARDQAFYS